MSGPCPAIVPRLSPGFSRKPLPTLLFSLLSATHQTSPCRTRNPTVGVWDEQAVGRNDEPAGVYRRLPEVDGDAQGRLKVAHPDPEKAAVVRLPTDPIPEVEKPTDDGVGLEPRRPGDAPDLDGANEAPPIGDEVLEFDAPRRHREPSARTLWARRLAYPCRGRRVRPPLSRRRQRRGRSCRLSSVDRARPVDEPTQPKRPTSSPHPQPASTRASLPRICVGSEVLGIGCIRRTKTQDCEVVNRL